MNVDIILSKLKLFRQLKENKFHMLTFGVYKNTLRAYVREGSGIANEKTKLIFNLPIMLINARLFADALKDLPKQKEGYVFTLDLYAPEWNNDKIDRSKKKLQGRIGIAKTKNADGDIMNLIYLTSDQNVKYVFPLINTPYVEISENGERIKDKEKLSNIWTKAYYKTFDSLLSLFPEIHVVDKDEGNRKGKQASKKNNEEELGIDDIF